MSRSLGESGSGREVGAAGGGCGQRTHPLEGGAPAQGRGWHPLSRPLPSATLRQSPGMLGSQHGSWPWAQPLSSTPGEATGAARAGVSWLLPGSGRLRRREPIPLPASDDVPVGLKCDHDCRIL